jgi:hypothetical protein
MSIYPVQTRTIDPYSSYNSNVVNALTRILTQGEDCLHSAHAIDVIVDPVSPLDSVIVSTGQCYKDDVILELTSDYNVDLTDGDYYPNVAPWNEAGYYYLVLNYTYIKAKPAPQASIKILKPSQRTSFSSGAYLLLKVLDVSFNGATFQLDDVLDYDPENPTVKRIYTRYYVGVEDDLPTFVQSDDEARLIYVRNKDELFFGTSQRWESFNAIRTNVTTTGCTLAQLVYMGSDGNCYPAIASSPSTFADAIVIGVGTSISGDGKVRLYGEVENVPIETGVTINVGDKLFLSDHTVGAVSNYISQPYSQSIGTCIYINPATPTICNIWFSPGIFGGGGGEVTNDSLYDKYQDLLLNSVFKYLFVDAFINDDYVDTSLTTSTIDTVNYEMDGVAGNEFYTESLTDLAYDGTCITSCQITSTMTNESNMLWYVSNNGIGDWEPITEFDQLHIFSTINVPATVGTGWLTIDEWVTGTASGNRAVVRGQTSNTILLSNEVAIGNWISGESLVGDDSGYTANITAPVSYRENCTDLRLYVYWIGTASIQDYGIIYDRDTEVDETSISNEQNIETLFADIYETPSLDNDGMRNYPFNDSTAFLIVNIVNRNSTISKGIIEIDNIFGTGQFEELDTTPSVIDKKRNYLTYNDSTSALIITMFDDAYNGQEITVIHPGGHSLTIQNGPFLHLASGSDYIMGIYDTLTLIYVSLTIGWVEKSRSNN